ncbi:L-histidine N(alpha)-methyltransferase [Nocardia alba]|uniref:L-histidine N-alpha-methyltransferase n=1 Tax=Nocardia alba TaxID=225051 RepID=A0A4R1FRG5_9NOCA|nr:L-histidine N(alpha)-methyltransferase [Nocardia alba]TCJ97537.1 L-histidine N-alpha-methyltransferase [Nocardia alba]
MLSIDRLQSTGNHGLFGGRVAEGLSAPSKWLPARLLFDARGVQLHDDIVRLPQFYAARSELAILAANTGAIAGATGACTLLELGARRPNAARLLIDGLAATLQTYIPVDFGDDALAAAAVVIARAYPRLSVRAMVADFVCEPHRLPARGGRLITLLGGVFGGCLPGERAGMLRRIRTSMEWDDTLLIGIDLTTASHRLIAARTDQFGVNATFNRNVLCVLNRELGAQFVTEQFEHRVVWDENASRVELRLLARCDQRVRIPALEFEVALERGTQIRTETVAVFQREQLESELAAVDLTIDRWWADIRGNYALVLAKPSMG